MTTLNAVSRSTGQAFPRKPSIPLSERARGRWREIYSELAPELADALERPGQHGPCPSHGGLDGFRLFKDYEYSGGGVCNTCGSKPNGVTLIAWLRNISTMDAAREIGKFLQGAEVSDYVPRQLPPPPEPDLVKARDAVWKIWSVCEDITRTSASLYLYKRGIFSQNIPKTLRFHPALPYWERQKREGQAPGMVLVGNFPAMVAPITDETGYIISLHRTFLTPDGKKAPVASPKKVMTACRPLGGSAIKLAPADDRVLCLSEGIETALAVLAVTGRPTWATTTATLMEQVAVPASVEEVWVFADLDRSQRGVEAAEVLRKRLVEQGKTVKIFMPQGPLAPDCKGIDWNDVLTDKGFVGFPREVRKPRTAPPLAKKVA